MLTIQPKISAYHHSPKALSFKSNEGIEEDTKLFEEKTRFYEDQVEEYNEAIKDKHTPEPLKKIMKGFRILSEALLEGWAVAWGTSKGSKVIKSSIITTSGSKIAKEADGILKPITQGFKKSAKNLATAISNGFTHFKNSNFMKSVSNFFSKTAEKLNKNSVGKYVVKTFETIGTGFKIMGQKIGTGWNKMAASFKSENAGKTYDKISKGASKTLGIGAGAAGGYNAILREEKTSKKTDKKQDDDQVIDEDYDDGLEAALNELEDEE